MLEAPEWKFSGCNRAALELFEVDSEEEFKRLGPWDLSPSHQSDGEASGPKAKRMIEDALRDGKKLFEWTHTTIHGEIVPCNILLSKIEIGGKIYLQATVRDITEQKAMLQVLRQKTQEFEQVMRAISTSAIVTETDTRGVIIGVNDLFCKISGYSKEELVGRTHRMVSSGAHSKEFFSRMWDTIMSGRVWSGVLENQAKSGSRYFVKTFITPVFNLDDKIEKFLAILFDVTDQVISERKLEEAQRIAQIGSWHLDIQKVALSWTKEHYRLFEIDEKIVGQRLFELFRSRVCDEDLIEFDRLILQAMTNGKPFDYTYRVRMKEGDKPKFIQSIGRVTQSLQGLPSVLTGTSQDVTQKIEAEAQIEEGRRMAAHNSKLASLGEMSAGVAHEINNPLAVISGSLRLLEKFRQDDGKFKEKISGMEKSVERITKIVSGLRKFSRANVLVELKPHRLSAIVQDAIVMIESKAKANFINLMIELNEQDEILCDGLEIEQVVVNLINNAIDAIQNHEDRWVRVEVSSHPKEVVLRVIDSGLGISPEIEAKLFEPFFTTKPVGEGTGLGLSICKGILDHHKSSFKLDRRYKNTCFEIRFPKYIKESHAA